MVKTYQKRASELLNIEDNYVAYCFDEAISEFIYRLSNEEKPRFERENKEHNPGLELLLG